MKEEIIGNKYGRLLVLRQEGKNKFGIKLYVCACDCGNIKSIVKGALTAGRTRSCGCLLSEGNGNRKHGERKTRLYSIWNGMKYRCTAPKCKYYYRYGARGIKVCDEWSTYVPFRNWALSHGYSDSLKIDRVNNDGDYEPSNCKWSTEYEQHLNTSRSHRITIDGVTKTRSEWSKISGINYITIFSREKSGLSGRDLLQPLMRNYKRKPYKQ